MTKLEFSIIIPVFNDTEELKNTLNALKYQEYPKDLFEIIIVDNGSTDDSVEVAKRYENTKVLIEKNFLGSPYSCRNRGIEIAEGEYIIFLDSTCVPIENWLAQFKKAFKEKNADIIGGKVSFRFFNNKPTAAEYYDSMTNIGMKHSIEVRGVAKTANLAVKKQVIDKVGVFEEGRRSGGDLIWTQKAVSYGFKIDYCENAEVFKKARRFKELFKKQWRVAKAQPDIWKEMGMKVNFIFLFKRLFLSIMHSTIKFMFTLVKNFQRKILYIGKYPSNCKNELFGMAIIPFIMKITMRIGNIYGYYKNKY